MEMNPKDKWGMTWPEIVDNLLREAGYTKCGVMTESEEMDDDHPEGTFHRELLTLVDSLGKVRYFTTNWDWDEAAPDGSKGYYRLDIEGVWSDENVESRKKNDFRLLRAFEDAGLLLTDEEKKRLEWAKARWAKGKSASFDDYLEEQGEVN